MTASSFPAVLWTLLFGFNTLVLLYFLLVNTVYLVTGFFAFRSLRHYRARLESMQTDALMRTAESLGVTLIAPAFNEEATCVESTRALLTLRYPDFTVYFVNDGSTDDTLSRMIDAFEMEPAALAPTADLPTAAVRGVWRSSRNPNLWLIDKENGGKADGQNAGLNFCRTPLFGAIDADSLLEPDALTRVVRVFLEDARTVAAGGTIRIVNGCAIRSGQVVRVGLPKSLLARFQVLEYLRAFLTGRMGWDALDSSLIISGAFGVFRRTTAVAVGGYDTRTVGEDMLLTVRLHKYCREQRIPYRIAFVPDPVAWTECPITLKALGRQRDRWQRGLIESMWWNRGMLFNPRYGRIGLFAFPFFFFFEMLGPLLEGLGYLAFFITVGLGWAPLPYVLAFLCLAGLLGTALSFAALALEELAFRRYPKILDLLHLFGLAMLETVGYRQLNTYWRIRGFVSKLRGVTSWGTQERRGFEKANGTEG